VGYRSQGGDMGGHSRGGGRLVQESDTNGLSGDCAKLVVMEWIYVGERVSRVKKKRCREGCTIHEHSTGARRRGGKEYR
jgi:hypothetical protein